MKRFYTAILMALSLIQLANSQSIKDLVNYNKTELSGSARFTALAGAFGALGGDLSAIGINPASSSVFLHSEIGLTATFEDKAYQTSYFNTNTESKFSKFKFDQFGAVFVFNNSDANADWTRVSFAINVDDVAKFNDNYYVVGTNPLNSIDSYFLYYADGLEFSNLRLYDDETINEVYQILGEDIGYGAQQAFLGYQSFLIDPTIDADNTTTYVSNANYNNVQHDYLYASEGYHRKYSLNFSALYRNFLHLGMNINMYTLSLKQADKLLEFGYTENSFIQDVEFQNELITLGEGISVQLGAIARVSKNVRLGLTYDSPEWMTLQDETRQYIITSRLSDQGIIEETIAPDVINYYSETRVKIPSKLTGSFAYVFKNVGLLSFDYSYSDYSNVAFITNDDNFFQSINQQAKNLLKPASTIRIGGEIILGQITLRGGFFTEEGHRKDNSDERKGISFGLGYDFGGSALNLSVINQSTNAINSLYSNGLTDSYLLNQEQYSVMLSYNFKL